jgi:type IV secretory pathway protease TraF
MRTNLRILFVITGVVIGSAAVAAQSVDTTESRCPAGYWRMDTLCFNQSTGDVVLATPPTPSR